MRPKMNKTAASTAALGKTNSVEALLQAGANPALVDLQGRSALAFALAADHTSVVEVMHQPSFAEGDGGIHRLWRRKAPKAGMLPRAPPACRRRSLVAVPRGGGCGLVDWKASCTYTCIDRAEAWGPSRTRRINRAAR